MIFRFSSLSIGTGHLICPAEWSYPGLGKTVPSHEGLWKQSETVDALTIEEIRILEHIGIFSGWYQQGEELL